MLNQVIVAPHLRVPAGKCWPVCLIIRVSSIHVDSSAFFPSYSVNIKYERMSLLKLGLPAPPLLRRSEHVTLLKKWECLVTLVLQLRLLPVVDARATEQKGEKGADIMND